MMTTWRCHIPCKQIIILTGNEHKKKNSSIQGLHFFHNHFGNFPFEWWYIICIDGPLFIVNKHRFVFFPLCSEKVMFKKQMKNWWTFWITKKKHTTNDSIVIPCFAPCLNLSVRRTSGITFSFNCLLFILINSI